MQCFFQKSRKEQVIMLLQKVVGEETPSTLADKGCTWHRSCYQDVTNNHIKREHDDFFSKSNAIPPQGEPSNKRSRCSDINGFSIGMCVLCQSTELDAIERRNDDTIRVRYSHAADAIAAELKYHKQCLYVYCERDPPKDRYQDREEYFKKAMV